MTLIKRSIVERYAWMAQRFAVLVVLLFTVVGCEDGQPKRVSVAGRVLIDGEPLTRGNIMFVPEGGRPSSGTIGDDGRFVLRCFDSDDGALVGTHRVAISAKEIISENNVNWHAPPKYSDYTTSGLTYEINEPTDSLIIELTRDGEKSSGK